MSRPVRVGITSGRKGDELTGAFARSGASAQWGPTTGGDKVATDDDIAAAIDRVLSTEPAFFAASTGKGMRVLADAADRTGRRAVLAQMLDSARIAARGSKAVGGLGRLGVQPEWVAPGERDAEVVEWVGAQAATGDTAAVQVHGAPTHPYGALASAGLAVEVLQPYTSEPPDDPTPGRELIDAALSRELDIVVFTSPSAVHGLDAIARADGRDDAVREALAHDVAVAVVGPVTRSAAVDAGYEPIVEPAMHRSGSLVRAVLEWWALAAPV